VKSNGVFVLKISCRQPVAVILDKLPEASQIHTGGKVLMMLSVRFGRSAGKIRP